MGGGGVEVGVWVCEGGGLEAWGWGCGGGGMGVGAWGWGRGDGEMLGGSPDLGCVPISVV